MIRINTHQFMILSAGVLLGTTFMVIGTTVTGEAGRDAWMPVLPSFLIGIPFALMVLSLMPKYPNKNFLEITEKVLGKWFGKVFGFLFILVTLYFGASLSGQTVDIQNRTVLPLMSYYILVGGGLILTLYLYYSGFEVLARFAEVVFPLVLFSLVLICVFIIPRFEQGELFPMLDNGFSPLLKAASKLVPWSMEYVLFLFIALPFIPHKSNDLKQIRKGLFLGFFLVGIINTLVVVVQIMTFGPTETTRLTYGLLVLGNMVEISRTISGVESVFILVWMGAAIIKVTSFFYACMAGLRSVFGLKSRIWALAAAGIYFFIPMYILRGADVLVEVMFIDRYLILPLAVSWVPLVWGVDKWKHRQKGS